MMNEKLKKNLLRFKWFIKNYKIIKYNSEIFNNVHGTLTYNTDGLATSSNCDFINEPKFAKAYEQAKLTNPWPNFTLMWRIHVICWAADNAKRLEGDFVECGVNTGAYARAIIEYINFNSLDKKFYLMDTFEGLNQELITDSEKKLGIGRYKYRNTYEEVKKTFASFNTMIIKGSIPETLTQCDVQKVCFLSIDMNNMVPEIAAIEFFWDKVVINGMVILDDYGFPMHIHQKHAFDKFAASVGHEILYLPTGQGLILKTH